ncbi:MAG TPA: alpha/beta hydrolase [Hyphomicrobium sp.]|nr:alpha/beta hydrolase [Hyphomicrobium sp.]
MKRLSGFALALALLLPAAGLVTGCSQEASRQERPAEDKSGQAPEASAPAVREDDGSGQEYAKKEAAPPGTDASEAERAPEEPLGEGAPLESAMPEEAPAAGETPDTVGEASPAPALPDVAAPKPAAPSRAAPGADGAGPGGAAPEAAKTTAAPPPPPPGDNEMFDVVPVFYGTDRAVEPDPKRLQYGAERGHKLQLGRALVTVPTAHKVPQIERPWVIEIPYFKVKIYEEKEDTSKHFTLQEISALTKEEMLALVKERLAKSANFKDHAFVFVHGFNTSFDYALYRTAQIAYDLKFDGAPFVYSWPSGGKVASYTYDRGSAEQAEPHLAEFLDIVVKQSGAKSISLIAHSMGNELLLRVLERLRPQAPKGVTISQVILAAPDVDRDKFMNIAREITDFAKGVTLYAASNDRALGYSARFWGGVPRAGDVPAAGPLIVPGVDTIDVSAVSTDSLGLNHSGYAENNALLNDIKLLLQTGERPPDKRIPILEHMTTASGGEYWRYPPVK